MHESLSDLGKLAADWAEIELDEVARAIVNAGPLLGADDNRMMTLGNSAAWSALNVLAPVPEDSLSDYHVRIGTFVTVLAQASRYAQSIKARFNSALAAAHTKLEVAIEEGRQRAEINRNKAALQELALANEGLRA